MKKNIIWMIALFAMIISINHNLYSQEKVSKKTVVSDTLHVHGVCGMCKDRIENAALVKGVKKATWDKQTHQLIVFYKSSKISLDEIEKKVANAGHDTEHYKADQEVYNSLPKCCAYRSGEVHTH